MGSSADGAAPERIDVTATGRVSVGRLPDNDVQLSSVNISRMHAKLSLEGNKLTVTDHKSMHGVCVNDKRIPSQVPFELKVGDHVVFGKKSLSPYAYEVRAGSSGVQSRKRQRGSDMQGATEARDDSLVRLVKKNKDLEAERLRVEKALEEAEEAKVRAAEAKEAADKERQLIKEQNDQLRSETEMERRKVMDALEQAEVARKKAAQTLEQAELKMKEALAARTAAEQQSNALRTETEKERQRALALEQENQKGQAVLANEKKKSEQKESVIQGLNEELTCGVCFELMTLAHALPCSHTFCYECITDWLVKAKTCPECRAAVNGAPVPVRSLDKTIDRVALTLGTDEQKDRTERMEQAQKKQREGAVVTIDDDEEDEEEDDDYDDDEDEEPESHWSTENARSGRARCRTCGGLIANGTLRWVQYTPADYDRERYESTCYHHYTCVDR